MMKHGELTVPHVRSLVINHGGLGILVLRLPPKDILAVFVLLLGACADYLSLLLLDWLELFGFFVSPLRFPLCRELEILTSRFPLLNAA